MPFLLVLAATQTRSYFDFRVEPGGGLFVECQGIPVVRGSSIQFYKPGWSKGYYSTNSNSQKIENIDGNTVRMSFTSDDKLAQGVVTYRKNGDKLQVHYDLTWNGDDQANLEISAGLLWSPAFERGALTADGKPARDLTGTSYKGEGMEERRFSPDASLYSFLTPIGAVSEHSSTPLTLFDGRGYNQDWAANLEYWWLGTTDLAAPKGKTESLDVEYQFSLLMAAKSTPFKGSLTAQPTSQALLPDTTRPPLIPKPDQASLDWDHPLVYTGALTFPAGEFDHLDLFKAALSRRFEVPVPLSVAKKVPFDAGISKMSFIPGGYRIKITDHSISVLGEEDEGLRDGLERLAAMAFISNGKICFPTGSLVDQPQTEWRGVHLFVGNQALPFQKRLWTRVLRPLGFNKVVLQCERTKWDSLPGIEGKLTMSKEELVRLFKMYRDMGVDPIPLVESYGHMEWLFANGKNLDVAFNPSSPYSVDPRKPATKALMDKLWDEIITTVRPSTVHFGLDEVDMIGMPKDPALETDMWAKQLGTLESIARSHNVGMMLWGDQCLAPGEAPDAALADDPKVAAERRSAIPRGCLIGDWHYLADSDPVAYRKTLETWRDAGMSPIASTWYQPRNIAGFNREAGLLHCGTLQTTWCGYDSTEAGMLDAYNQFTAMILAADYSWSARKELPETVGYDPSAVFRKMYFGAPSALTSKPGFDLTTPTPAREPFTIGQVRYGRPCKLLITSSLQDATGQHGLIQLVADVTASKLQFAMNTVVKAPEDGALVARVEIVLKSGKVIEKRLVYGVDVRSANDKGPLPLADRDASGLCSVSIDLGAPKTEVRAIEIIPANGYIGLSIKGIEATG
jgi:hypothetical protein